MKRLLTVFAMAVAAMAFAVGAKAQISVGAGYGLATHVAKTLGADDEVLDDEDEDVFDLLFSFCITYNFLNCLQFFVKSSQV